MTSIVAGSFIVLFLAQFAVVRTILLRNFAQLEENNALVNATRIQNALDSKISRLNDASLDYSTWDETYHFVKGSNLNYVELQLYDSIFASLKINMIGIADHSGKLLAQKSVNFYTLGKTSAPLEFLKNISFSASHLNHPGNGKTQGILSSSAGPMLVASQPILDSNGKGLGSGVLSMGRLIDSQMLKDLSSTTQLPIYLYRYQDLHLPQEIQEVINTKLRNTKIAAQVLGADAIASYVRVNDVLGKPAIVLKAQNDRKIYIQGLTSLSYYFWSTFLIGILFCGVVLGLLEYFVLSRLSHLSQGVRAIGYHGNLSNRVSLQGQDELALLARTINQTLDRLQQIQQDLQSSEERYALAVIGAKDGIWDWNLLDNEFYFSERLQAIVGYDADELKAAFFRCFNPQDPLYLSEFKGAIDAHLQGLTPYLEHEQRMIRKDGTEQWVLYRGAAVRDGDGKPYRMAGSLTDINDRKAAAQLFIRQAEELVRSNQELEQFAYIASHDLQEPLRKIEAFGDRLRNKCDKALDQQGLDYLARIQNAASRMRILLQDLLAFSRVTTQSRGFTDLSLATLLQEVLGDLEVRIQETKADISFGSMPTLEADPLQMRQLFQNLISNALKFQKPGVLPKITIECSESCQEQSVYCITVTDNGIGFDEKYLDRIFKVFQRLHGRSEYEGTGIGLAVCAKIVERHRGQLTARSMPGHGATFMINLPRQQLMLEGDEITVDGLGDRAAEVA